jgi:hypothetical protein
MYSAVCSGPNCFSNCLTIGCIDAEDMGEGVEGEEDQEDTSSSKDNVAAIAMVLC